MKKGRKPKSKSVQKGENKKKIPSFLPGENSFPLSKCEENLPPGRKSLYQSQTACFEAETDEALLDFAGEMAKLGEGRFKPSEKPLQNGGPVTRRKEHQMLQSSHNAIGLNTVKKFDDFYKEKRNLENEVYFYHPPRVSQDLFQARLGSLDTNNFNRKINYVQNFPVASSAVEVFSFDKLFDYSRVSQDDLNYYLKFVGYYKESCSSSISGNLFLKGLHSFESAALKLLRECDYDIGSAFHKILFPVLNLLELDGSSNADQMIFVNSALNDLIGSNIQEKEAWLEHVKQRIQLGISLPDLQDIIDLGGKMKIDIPDFITAEIEASSYFSRIIKRHLNEKNSIDDINNLLEQARQYKVKTEEFLNLEDVQKKLNLCLSRSEEIENKTVIYKALQSLYHEMKSLPVFFPNFDRIKLRYLKAQKWQEKYAKIPKHSKTRGQGNSTVKKGSQKDERCTIAYLHQMILESDEINFTSNDVAFLKSNFEKLREAESRISMTLQDDQTPKTRDLLNDFANTLDSLKFTTEMYDQIVSQLEYLAWEDQKNCYMNNKVLKMKHLRSLLKEAVAKNIHILPEIIAFKQTLNDIEVWMEKMTNIFYNCIEEEEEDDEIKVTKNSKKDKKYSIEDLNAFYVEGKSFSLKPEEVEHLLMKCEEFFEFQEECRLASSSVISSDFNSKFIFEKLNTLKKTITKYNINCEEFNLIENQINLVHLWGHQYESFALQYKKLATDYKFSFPEIDSLHVRQEIIEMLESYRRRNTVFYENLIELSMRIPPFAKFSKEYEDLVDLKTSAEEHMSLTCFDNSCDGNRSSYKFFPHEMDLPQLESFLNFSHLMCISREYFGNLLCVFRAKSWIQLAHIKEKMTLQDAEILIKEAQSINFFTAEIEDLRNNIQRTKEWVKLNKKIVSRKDKTKYEELKLFIKEGMELPLQTSELDYLLNFLKVCDDEILEVRAFLQREHSMTELEEYYEALNSYPVSEIPEFDLLLSITKAAHEWRVVASKIIQSRQLSELYFKVDSPAAMSNFLHEELNEDSKQPSSPQSGRIEVELTEEFENSCTGNNPSKRKQKKNSKETPAKKSKPKPSTNSNSLYNDHYLNISAELKLILKKAESLDQFSKCRYLQQFIVLREDTPSEKYCICRRGDDGINYMLMCEGCKEWFHGGCVKITQISADKINQYICVCCSRRKDLLTNSYSLDFLNYRRISKSKLIEVMVEGSEIATSLEEMKVLEANFAAMMTWLRNYESLMQDLIEFEKSQSGSFAPLDESLEKSLISLYHESEGFLAELEEATNIVVVLKQYDLFRQAQRSLEAKKISEKSLKKLVLHGYSVFNLPYLTISCEVENIFFTYSCRKGMQVLTELIKLFEKSSSDAYSDVKLKFDKRYAEVLEAELSRLDLMYEDKAHVKDIVEQTIDKLKTWENEVDLVLSPRNFNEKTLSELVERSKLFNFKYPLLDKFKSLAQPFNREQIDNYRALIFDDKRKKEQLKKFKR